MKLFLTLNIGSTYTKLNLFDLDIPVLLAQSQAHTSIHSSLFYGFQEAFPLS